MRVFSCLTTGRISGVDVFAVELTRGLLRRGVEASIVLTEPARRVPDPLPLPEDVPIERSPYPGRWDAWRGRRWLRGFLTRHAPCVVLPNYDYAHSAITATLPGSIVVVGAVHSDDPLHYDHASLLGEYWNATVAVSRTIAEKVSRANPRWRSRVVSIPYGIDLPPAPTRRENRVLQALYIGRIEQDQKRVLDLARWLDVVSARDIAVELTLVGSGPAEPELRRAAEAHLAAGRLRIQASVPHEAMQQFYRRADLFLLPSAYEGLPVSLLEAMAHGCVPLATEIESGVPELIRQGQNGFLTPVGEVEQVANHVAELARNPELRARMSAAAHRTIVEGEYSRERMVERYLDLFERLQAEAARGAFVRPRVWPGQIACRAAWRGAQRRVRRRLGLRMTPQLLTTTPALGPARVT